MSEIPQPGTGSVSLNTAEAQAEASEPVAPKEAGAISIPVIDDEEDNIEVADLEVNGDGSVSLLQQKNLKLWGAILGAAIIVLIGVFFFLARQTSLFQGSLQFGLEDDEVVITDPNFDSSSEESLTPPGGDELPIGSEETPILSPGGETPNDEAPIFGDDFEDIIGQFEQDNPPMDDEFIVEDNNGFGVFEPVVPDFTPDPTQDPEFNNDVLVDIPDDSSDSMPPATQINNDSPSLISNTDPNVLGSAEVQGNTGPGILIYVLPPLAAYMIRRKNVR